MAWYVCLHIHKHALYAFRWIYRRCIHVMGNSFSHPLTIDQMLKHKNRLTSRHLSSSCKKKVSNYICLKLFETIIIIVNMEFWLLWLKCPMIVFPPNKILAPLDRPKILARCPADAWFGPCTGGLRVATGVKPCTTVEVTKGWFT